MHWHRIVTPQCQALELSVSGFAWNDAALSEEGSAKWAEFVVDCDRRRLGQGETGVGRPHPVHERRQLVGERGVVDLEHVLCVPFA
jgi:hypothetical protein